MTIMKARRRTAIQGISALGLLGPAHAARAAASDYPNQPIHVIVPYSPGSGTDIVPRAFAEFMSQDLKQTIIVDNRPGADGMIGTGAVGRAAPDGYTLLAGAAGPLVTGAYIQNVNFDPAKTLVPVAMLAYSPFVLIVPASSSYKSVQDLAGAAKANPGKITFASTGIGSSGHLAGALFEKDAGVTMLHVPYAGASNAMVDVIAGRVDCFFAAFPSASTAIKGKQVRAIAMATLKRSPLMPELPTVAEAGYPDFDTGTWIAIMAPAGTPANAIDVLYQSIAKTIEKPKIKAFLAQIGCEPDLMDAGRLGDYLASERARWRELIEEFGLARK